MNKHDDYAARRNNLNARLNYLISFIPEQSDSWKPVPLESIWRRGWGAMNLEWNDAVHTVDIEYSELRDEYLYDEDIEELLEIEHAVTRLEEIYTHNIRISRNYNSEEDKRCVYNSETPDYQP